MSNPIPEIGIIQSPTQTDRSHPDATDRIGLPQQTLELFGGSGLDVCGLHRLKQPRQLPYPCLVPDLGLDLLYCLVNGLSQSFVSSQAS